MKNIIIIGAGGVGKETAMLIEEINHVNPSWNLLGFVDDDSTLDGKTVNDYTVLGRVEVLNHFDQEIFVICTISNPSIKKMVIQKIVNPKLKFANLIHPNAVISKDIEMGEDIIIQAGCVITTNVKLGSHIQINPKCGIGHESTIMDYCSLYWNVHVSGNVTIEEGCVLGTNATVIQGLRVGAYSILGASANVIREVCPNSTMVGNPAKAITQG